MYDYELRREDDMLLVVMERGDTDLSPLLKKISVDTGAITDVRRKYYWAEMLQARKSKLFLEV